MSTPTSLHDAIDIYCERLDASFWAEPVNALTNLGFVLAAAWAWRAQSQRGTRATDLRALALSCGLIGLCSFAFHTTGLRWAALLDSLSILLFMLGFAATWCQRALGWPWPRAAVGAPALAAFLTLGVLAVQHGAPALGLEAGFDVSLYLSAWLAVAVMAWATPRALPRQGSSSPTDGQPLRRALWATAGVFAVSIGLRQADAPLCEVWPLGTHFAWHLCNALALALSMHGLTAATGRRG